MRMASDRRIVVPARTSSAPVTERSRCPIRVHSSTAPQHCSPAQRDSTACVLRARQLAVVLATSRASPCLLRAIRGGVPLSLLQAAPTFRLLNVI
jgi:hypothetical protein